MKILKKEAGFSLIEVLLASAMFVVIVSSIAGAMIYGLQGSVISGTKTRASYLAEEGIEATRNIRDNDFANLVDGPHGITISSNTWAFSGTYDTVDSFTRQIDVTTIDVHTKRVDSTVSWQATPTQTDSLTVTTYLTNWRRSVGRGGMLVYADLSGEDDTIRYKLLDANGSWGPEQTVPDINVPGNKDTRRVELYSSPSGNEKILITKHCEWSLFEDGQHFYAQVWDGSSWGNLVKLTSYWVNINPQTKNFDGDFMINGNFIVIYDDFTNMIKYRLWDGTNWSGAMDTVDTGGLPVWAIVRNRPGNQEAMVVIRDGSEDTNTFYWTGSSWTPATEHGTDNTSFSGENISFAWSPNNPTFGALMFNESNNANPNIKIWNGTAWSESTEPSIGGRSLSYKIIARPHFDEFLACTKDNSKDINCVKSDFTPIYTPLTNGEVATNTDDGGQISFDLGYESISGDTAVVVYSNGADATARIIPKYRTYNAGTSSFSTEMNLPALGPSSDSSLESARVIPDPNSNDMMVLMGASDQDVWSVIWNGSTNQFYTTGDQGPVEHGTSGSDDLDHWYDFEWD
ncbi:MAG: hypothetical protein U9Q67_04840 [Patescibacteria group bacterium]|nr:hypothetical protein [Patescibacteria group bacterium]